MKKLGIIFLLVIFAMSTYGQRRVLTSAWNFWRDGFLGDAKEAIDRAAEHPDTKDNFRTFWYKGLIYHDLAVTDNKRYAALCDEGCLDIALENYMKALVLNFSDEEHQNLDLDSEVGVMKFFRLLNDANTRYQDQNLLVNILMERFAPLSNAFINRGVTYFQEKQDFEAALSDFEQALIIAMMSGNQDLEIMYYASLAALRAEDYEKAAQYNKTLLEAGYGETEEDKIIMYQALAKAYELKEEYEKMLKALQEGIEKYPEHSYPLVIETFNYYVNSEQSEEALKYIALAIEQNPEDPQFYVIKGALLEELGRRDEAANQYVTALELNPNNFDAAYSVGAFYYNTAVDTLQWAEENIVITEFAKHDEIREIANKYFDKAKPYLERALELNEENLNVLNTLRVVYYRLQMMEEYQVVQDKVDELSEQRRARQEQVEE